MTIRRYSELIKLPSFEERFDYLKLGGRIGDSTFGYERFLNQTFYHSAEWRAFRKQVIVRDNGFDLGCEDMPIFGRIEIHHLNPITINEDSMAVEIMKLLEKRKIDDILVTTADGKFAGLVDIQDLPKFKVM